MMDVGACMPGCGVCVIVDTHGVHMITNQMVCKAMNASICADLRRIFAKSPKQEIADKARRSTEDYTIDVEKCSKYELKIIDEFYDTRFEELAATHFCLFFYDCNRLTYRAYTKNFPLNLSDIDELSKCIFKTWAEMQTANISYGEHLLHERV